MFTIPRSTSAEEREAFRQIRVILEGMQVVVLESESSLGNLKDGQTAYLTEDGVTCRYVRVNGKLICEKLTAPEASAVKRSLLQRVGDEKRQQAGELAGARRVAKNEIENSPRSPRASLIRTVDVRVNAALIDTTEFDQRFEYEVGKNPAGTEFRIRWYETSEAWQDGTPEASVGDAPITIEWLPATPVETEGEHRGVFRYKLNPNTTGEFDFLGDIDVI